jgi:hypothetical protein
MTEGTNYFVFVCNLLARYIMIARKHLFGLVRQVRQCVICIMLEHVKEIERILVAN